MSTTLLVLTIRMYEMIIHWNQIY